MCSEERGEGGEGSNANARLCMCRRPVLDIFRWVAMLKFCLVWGCYQVSVTQPCRWGSNAPPSHGLVALPLKAPPTSSPRLPMHNERTNRSVAWHARHVMGMRWSEASLSPEEPLHLREEGGGVGRQGTEGEFQAGMKVKKPYLLKEPKRKQKQMGKI